MNGIIKLDFPRECNKESYFKLVQEFSEKNEDIIPASMILKEGEAYEDFLVRCQNYRKGINMKKGYVPFTLLFIINKKNEVVGGIELRHELTEDLRFNGGHIGYGIKPSERKKGYASDALKLVLAKAKGIGIERILINCKKENIGSAKVIQNNGGKRDSDYEVNGVKKERYWIEL